jgi:voltage-gated potassium channel
MRAFLARRKYTLLLAVAVLAEVLQPLAKGLKRGVFFDGLLAVLLASVFLVVLDKRRQRTIGLCLGIPALVTNWLHYLQPARWDVATELLYHAFTCAFFLYAAVTILGTIFRRRDVTVDAVLGAVCGYLITGAAFANLYTAIELLQPGSFSINSGIIAQLDNWHSRRFLFGYFSLVTLTTMGYGDITPLSPSAASLSWLEAVVGQFYMAVVVAQLVGIRIGQRISADVSSSKERR